MGRVLDHQASFRLCGTTRNNPFIIIIIIIIINARVTKFEMQ